jgi:hypothetical protein
VLVTQEVAGSSPVVPGYMKAIANQTIPTEVFLSNLVKLFTERPEFTDVSLGEVSAISKPEHTSTFPLKVDTRLTSSPTTWYILQCGIHRIAGIYSAAPSTSKCVETTFICFFCWIRTSRKI